VELDAATVHSRRWYALAVMCLSLFVITIDNTVLNVAIPSLIKDLGATTSQLQWIVDGYTLVFAGLLLTAGSLGDRFGRKGALAIGLTIFTVGSAASAFAGSASTLIFTRAFMGIGGALIMPATLSLLTNVFHDPRERGRAIGMWAAVAGASAGIGPVVGGILLAHFSWGSVFLINVPIGITAIVAGRFVLPTSRDPHAPKLDPVGALLSIAGLVAVLWAVIEAPVKGWTSTPVVAAFAIGIGGIVAFVLWELHSSHPMLDVRFFENRRFTAANSAITLVYFAMFGAGFLFTQYLQDVLGFSPLEAGLRLLPQAAVLLVVAPLSPRLTERLGTKIVVGSGLVIAAAGLLLVRDLPVSGGYPLLLTGLVVAAIGMGLVMAPATESVMGSLPKSKAGVGSAMNDTTRQMGGALGVAVIGSLFASVYRPGISDKLAAAGAPLTVVNAAKDSLGSALNAASSFASPVRDSIDSLSRQEFVHALGGALALAAGALLVAAVIVFAFLPARAADHGRADTETALDGLASLTNASAEGMLEATEDAAVRTFAGDGDAEPLSTAS
jgi:EmrB/QacA subfamily drug resistance transporter